MVRIHISIFQKWEWFCFTSTLQIILYSGIFWWKLQNFLIFSNFCPETYLIRMNFFAYWFSRTQSHSVTMSVWIFVLWHFVLETLCPSDILSVWHFFRVTFCLVTFCPWPFVRVTFCPVTFCVCGILSVTFCPSDVLSCNILSLWHFVRVAFYPVAFCPWHFVRVTFFPFDILS